MIPYFAVVLTLLSSAGFSYLITDGFKLRK